MELLLGILLVGFCLWGGWAIFNDPLASKDWSHDHPPKDDEQ